MAKRRGRAISLDGLVARLSELDKERQAITDRLRTALGSLGLPSPFSTRSSALRRRHSTGRNVKSQRPRKRRTMSAAQRKAVSQRMRKYWAARRKEAAK